MERHRVALVRSSVSRGMVVRSLVSTRGSAALHAMCTVQVEIAITIDNERSLNYARSTVVFDRRRLRADLHIDVLAAPVSGGNVLHLLSPRDNRDEEQQTNKQYADAILPKHKSSHCRAQ